MQLSDSIVIIPTYNERENIENIIRAVFGLDKVFHILVIEDGSPDGTANWGWEETDENFATGILRTPLYDRAQREVRIGYCLHRRIQVGVGARIRIYLRNGCRFQP